MKFIKLIIDGTTAIYDSESNIISCYYDKVLTSQCSVPKNWDLTRVIQFMESIIKATV